MAGLQLEWQRASPGAPSAVVKPLAVLLPWVWSEAKYVDKYTRLCHQDGWDVLVVRWPMLALWFPLWSAALASSLLAALGQELSSRGARPVVFWSFSGAAKGVYAALLSQLASPKSLKPQQAAYAALVMRCAVGQIYDSGPVDFSSDMGRKLLSPNSRPHSSSGSSSSSNATAAALGAAARSAAELALSAGVDVAAGALDFFLMEWFDRDSDNMWSCLTNSPVGGPVLMLYSRKDELADAAQIASLAASLKRRGRHVLEQVWHDSPHVGHLRAHPQEYTAAVTFLFAQSLQEWSARSSRRWEGRDWTQRWQQQQQQSTQQQQQPDSRGSVAGDSSVRGSVSSNYSGLRQLQPQQQQQQQQGCCADHSTTHSSDWDPQQQQQQQQQLVLQPTKGVYSTGRLRGASKTHHSSSSGSSSGSSAGSNGGGYGGSSSSRQTATLVRSRTSGSSDGGGGGSSGSSAELAAAVTGPPAAAAAAAAAGGVVCISGWSATATAVAAAMSEEGGELSDATLLSHSLKCLARSYFGSSSSALHSSCSSSGCSSDGVESQQQQLLHRPVAAAAAAGGVRMGNGAVRTQQQQQQAQPFMMRMVNRLRSRL